MAAREYGMGVRLASRMARLGEPGAPFRFQKGDRVAWIRFDGTPDFEYAGVIVDGECEYQPGVGAYKAGYLVQRADGSYFGVDHAHLMRLSTRESGVAGSRS
jgi:hypothetical protein